MPRDSKLFSCFFLLTREHSWLSLVMQQGGEAWGSCPDAQGLQSLFLLLLYLERITLVRSGHAAGRGGVGKLSQRSGTPNFVPCFFFLTREYPWLNLVTQQGGEGWVSCRDAQGLQTLFPASSFPREINPG